jgi:hypothetical protein
MNAITTIKTAASAAWKTWLIGAGFTAFTYLAYLGMNAGWLDTLIGWGVYGPVTREELAKVTFHYVGAMKLIGMVFFLGAAFLSMWWRKLQQAQPSDG